MKRKRVVVLGATGSIGESAAKVARDIPERVEIVGIAANSKARELAAQANELRPAAVCIVDETKLSELRANLKYEPEIFAGETGLREIASTVASDMVLVAIVGTGGLRPALAAIEAGKDLAVASKEILVMAGEIVMRKACEKGVQVLPVDSEHNAIFQCMPGGYLPGDVARGVTRVILTASGGPFRCADAGSLTNVTPDEACAHPKWKMGRKISVDSATLMNKGLEIIEATLLFGLPETQVDVLVHPQSVVHSLVEYADGSMLAQLGAPDMRTPIAQALAWPARFASGVQSLNLAEIGQLAFEPPDHQRFPALTLARGAARAGGTAPALLNAANEVAVQAFLDRRLNFTAIAAVIDRVLQRLDSSPVKALGDVLDADAAARRLAEALIELERGAFA